MGAGLDCCCREGGARSFRAAGPQENGTTSTCDLLAARQANSRGTILPNNSGHNPMQTYQLDNRAIGVGACGTVRKARNTKTGAICAVKMIKKEAIPNLDMFTNEVDLNTSMDHPNITRLFETFEDRHQVYLVMELCEGGELFDRIIDQGYFGEVDAAVSVKQVLSAVYYMHRSGIAHRDLKPENFILKDKAVPITQNTLKVIDFGIARRFSHQATEQEADNPVMSTTTGTAYYVAPEVCSTRSYSEKCDVWSIGVILYILLSGTPPFSGNSDAEIMKKVVVGKISFNLPEFDHVSDGAKDLILKMCEMSPQKRLSAGQALNSAWVQETQPDKADSSKASLAVGLLTKLKSFSSVNRFKKAALAVIAHRIEDSQIQALRDTFHKLDKNGDGTLTLSEMKDACSHAGLSNSQDVKGLFEKLDLDGSGEVGYTEFLAGMIDSKSYLQEELCWEAFRTFDRDGSGQIDKDELKEMLREKDDLTGSKLGSENVDELFRDADSDGDGRISFEEFMAMLRRK